jgi:hypothetical protein
MTNCCAGCAEPGKHSHTTDCLFEHFLGFMNLTERSDEEKALMRTAYAYGKEEGERVMRRTFNDIISPFPRRMAMQEPT